MKTPLVHSHASSPEDRCKDYQTFAADSFRRGDMEKHEAYLELARKELIDSATLPETR